MLSDLFTLYTDHESLALLSEQELKSGRLARWAQRMAEFDYSVVYIKGASNVADGLSRAPTMEPTTPVSASTITTPRIASPFKAEEELAELKKEAYFGAILRALQATEESLSLKLRERVARFRLQDGQLFLQDGQGRSRLCVPQRSRAWWLEELHNTPEGGHQGAARTYEKMAGIVFWPNLYRSVQVHVRRCDRCLRNKASQRTPAGPAEPLAVPERPWQSVSLDFMDLPVSTTGRDCVLIITDRFSKVIHVMPTSRTVTAQGTADLLLEGLVRLHGLPDSLISDRDPRFTSAIWEALWKAFGTRLKMTTAHRPQGDGQSERSNRSVQTVLRSFVNSLGTDWDSPRVLSLAELALNSAIQTDTAISAMHCAYGQEPVTPSRMVVPQDRVEELQARGPAQVQSLWHRVEQARREAQQRMEEVLDAKRGPPGGLIELFPPGSEVLLHTRNYPHLRANKLMGVHVGPFRVSSRPSQGVAVLELPPSMKIHSAINIDQLKRYERPVDVVPPPGPLRTARDGVEIFEVAQLLDKRRRYKKLQYLVRWRGYGPEFNSWEPESAVKHLHLLIDELNASSAAGGEGV